MELIAINENLIRWSDDRLETTLASSSFLVFSTGSKLNKAKLKNGKKKTYLYSNSVSRIIIFLWFIHCIYI